MSSELRTKIAAEIRLHAPCIVEVSERAADRILALLPPPATAKLPEDHLVDSEGKVWRISRRMTGTSNGNGMDDNPPDWVQLVPAALSAPPVPGESKPTPGTSVRCSTCGFDGMNHIATAARDAETIRSQAACIAELEAEVASNAQREIIVLIESVGWKHDGNGHWTHKNFNGPYGYRAAAESTLYRGARVEPTPGEKTDPRKVAPNGRAMVEWRRVDDDHVISRDDSCHWWYWLYGEMRWEPCRLDPELFKPCTFDGTPITEMKPDPLARAVTVGEFNEKMQRLADIYVRAGMPTTAKFIRDAFTSTQGAAHAE